MANGNNPFHTMTSRPQLLLKSESTFNGNMQSRMESFLHYLTIGDNENLWYKFIVKKSANYSKDFILRSVLDAFPPVSQRLVPIKFFKEHQDSIFYSKLCCDVVLGFIRRDFKLHIQEPCQVVMEVEIIVGIDGEIPTVNVEDLIRVAVQRRVVAGISSGSLNLSSFHTDPELDTYCFFPLSLAHNLQNVLKYADQLSVAPLRSLDLSYNCLKQFNRVLENLPKFKNLVSLNLKGNQLLLASLRHISYLPLTKLEVDGNDLCSFYDNELDYIKDIQGVFPALKSLDNCDLCSSGFAVSRRFFCKPPSSQDFLEQFLTHYFSIFDSDNRHLLFGLYHTDAMFSLTSTLTQGQTTTSNANMSNYLSESRNILKIVDWAKSSAMLHKGNKQVMDAVKRIPKTQHDHASFTADVLIFEPTYVKISVTGLFREPEKAFSSVRFFKRNFVLHCFNKVYLILNDMLFITNCTSEQAAAAFQAKTEPVAPLDLFLTTRAMHVNLSNEQKVKMVEKISEITDMNQEWCRRCLEDVQYDLRNALVYFQKHYENKLIPNEAFLK